ncbi:hypothetical protein [Prosthecobacter sp.]|uniref:hypothetical protein n=1 Tax=Prosthecobacter sp. TaxID=1965333 RepID=UPI00378338B9
MIQPLERITILQRIWRGIPHERTEFAWTPGALTGKSSFVEMSAANNATLIEKSGTSRMRDHWLDAAGCFTPDQMQAVHITLETAKIRRD